VAASLFSAYFVQNRNIAELPVLEALAAEQGLASDAVARYTADPAIKASSRPTATARYSKACAARPIWWWTIKPFLGRRPAAAARTLAADRRVLKPPKMKTGESS
jgi:hypothetical protein